MVYENKDNVMIGLEIHVQLNMLNTKVFCGCTTDYHGKNPNSCNCPVCMGLPGVLPVINKKAVEFSIKVGLALNCGISEHTQFHRKNYFYPDLPKAFQTTQYDHPIAHDGYVLIEGENGESRIRINRAHMEEDPGKLIHEGTINKSKFTLIDYNRSGMALLEIVTEPDLRSPKEARRFLDKLKSIIDYLGVSDTDLEGAMRVDSNVSIMGGNRAEVKNISSFKGAEKAMLYEIIRQKNVLKRGGTVVQETRHFDEARSVTIGMRTKEEENDYRYFPEPDLVPLNVSDWAPHIMETLPELPDAKRERLMREYGITVDHAKSIVTEMALADYYEAVAAKVDAQLAAVWVVDVLLGELKYRVMSHIYTLGADIHYDAIPGELNYHGVKFSVDNIVSIARMVAEGTISDRAAVEVIRTVLDDGGTPAEVVQAKGLGTASDDVVSVAAREAVDQNPAAVEDYRKGQEKALNSLVGHVMKVTRGSADPKTAREEILKVLGEGY